MTQARRAAYDVHRWRDTMFVGHEQARHERLRCIECGDKCFAIRNGKAYCSHCVEEVCDT